MNAVVGTREEIAAKIKSSKVFQSPDERNSDTKYPFYQDGLSGMTIDEQLASLPAGGKYGHVFWMEFRMQWNGEIVGEMKSQIVRVM